jgi:hypothetical protein
MKNITQRVIEFLSHAELPFGGEEDLLLLDDPAAFQARVTGLLDEYPQVLGATETAELKGKLDEVAWSFVGLEFQARIETAARFFDGDAREAQ